MSLPLAQVQGSGWRLDVEGRPGAGEPRFSTWDEVLSGRAGAKQGAPPAGTAGAPVELAYYNALGVAPSASQVEIKAAYRAQALRLHPDVSDAPDATQRFTELAQAYGVHCAVLCCAVPCLDGVGVPSFRRTEHGGKRGGCARAVCCAVLLCLRARVLLVATGISATRPFILLSSRLTTVASTQMCCRTPTLGGCMTSSAQRA